MILEFASREEFDNISDALDEVSTSLFGRPYAQLAAEEYAPLRDVITRNVYVAPPPAM